MVVLGGAVDYERSKPVSLHVWPCMGAMKGSVKMKTVFMFSVRVLPTPARQQDLEHEHVFKIQGYEPLDPGS